ncbi:GFA family protein [Ramlibacter albus]|uniref:GFA family protein n=1 Tax=Ramlibacter albus TaxID=2079448 RepID=A0A923S2X4_9BURK|nr:GFA family protein [Ramlibacter albus]MBC5765845.1 GFA family protein [Ramlibacter albus]
MGEKHLGGCICGAVRYQVTGDPVMGTVCHCRFCQKRLASAFAVLASFNEEAVEFQQGETQEVEHRSDESGRWLRMRFCPKCGTTVSHTSQRRPGWVTIAAGTFDDPSWFAVTRHIWVRSKLPWVSIPEGAEAYEQAYLPPAS